MVARPGPSGPGPRFAAGTLSSPRGARLASRVVAAAWLFTATLYTAQAGLGGGLLLLRSAGDDFGTEDWVQDGTFILGLFLLAAVCFLAGFLWLRPVGGNAHRWSALLANLAGAVYLLVVGQIFFALLFVPATLLALPYLFPRPTAEPEQ